MPSFNQKLTVKYVSSTIWEQKLLVGTIGPGKKGAVGVAVGRLTRAGAWQGALRAVQHNNFSIYGAHSIWRPLNNGIHSPHTFSHFQYFSFFFFSVVGFFSESFVVRLAFGYFAKKHFVRWLLFLYFFFVFFIMFFFLLANKRRTPVGSHWSVKSELQADQTTTCTLDRSCKTSQKKRGLRSEKCWRSVE